MELIFIDTIDCVQAEQWDALWPTDYPFTQHRFLKLLETSGATDAKSGWKPHHVCVWESNQLIAAMPLFEKTHSYGEYVFDWGWADAYHRYGLEYYPKWVCAIPFTPSTGPRVGFAKSCDREKTARQLITELQSKMPEQNISSFHCLFPCAEDLKQLQSQLSLRLGVQFHWINQQYENFTDFLSQLSSRKRKNIRKEREKVSAMGLDLQFRAAGEVPAEEWQQFYTLYQITYLKRSGHSGYLNAEFFSKLAEILPEQTLLASAHQGGKLVAGALYFRDQQTLYGRYWGALDEYDCLHFECCYYQGIEYAIAHNIRRFDPGAQGEHKIQRGFTPLYTSSLHSIRHPEFRLAIDNFLNEERASNARYIQHCREHAPFKESFAMINEGFLLEGAEQL